MKGTYLIYVYFQIQNAFKGIYVPHLQIVQKRGLFDLRIIENVTKKLFFKTPIFIRIPLIIFFLLSYNFFKSDSFLLFVYDADFRKIDLTSHKDSFEKEVERKN